MRTEPGGNRTQRKDKQEGQTEKHRTAATISHVGSLDLSQTLAVSLLVQNWTPGIVLGERKRLLEDMVLEGI